MAEMDCCMLWEIESQAGFGPVQAWSDKSISSLASISLRRRVQLAQVLLGDADLLLLDEPTKSPRY